MIFVKDVEIDSMAFQRVVRLQNLKAMEEKMLAGSKMMAKAKKQVDIFHPLSMTSVRSMFHSINCYF